MRYLLQPFPPRGDAGANQLHYILRRSRWDGRSAESSLFLRLRGCKRFLDLDTLHRLNFFQSCAGPAIEQLHVLTNLWLFQCTTGSGGTISSRFIRRRNGIYERSRCGKLVRNRLRFATQCNRACQITQDKSQGIQLRRSRKQQSFASLPCNFRFTNQPPAAPIQALLKA